MHAVNADTGNIVWQLSLGSYYSGCADMQDGTYGIGGKRTAHLMLRIYFVHCSEKQTGARFRSLFKLLGCVLPLFVMLKAPLLSTVPTMSYTSCRWVTSTH